MAKPDDFTLEDCKILLEDIEQRGLIVWDRQKDLVTASPELMAAFKRGQEISDRSLSRIIVRFLHREPNSTLAKILEYLVNDEGIFVKDKKVQDILDALEEDGSVELNE